MTSITNLFIILSYIVGCWDNRESEENLKTIWKVLLGLLIVLLGLVVLVLVWAFISYPSEYVLRGIRWGDSDVYDYQKFPARPMAASPQPFNFEYEPAETMVQSLFEQNPAIDDLDEFLERNKTQAFIVIRDDAILYEKYYNGADRDTIYCYFLLGCQVLRISPDWRCHRRWVYPKRR